MAGELNVGAYLKSLAWTAFGGGAIFLSSPAGVAGAELETCGRHKKQREGSSCYYDNAWFCGTGNVSVGKIIDSG